MRQIEPLEYGKFYHIYNRGTNSCNLFFEHSNYTHFLNLYDTYISPVADTYAWVLMNNHFHLLVRIKDEADISFMSSTVPFTPSVTNNSDGSYYQDKRNLDSQLEFETTNRVFIPSHQFSHLFNAYAQAYNKHIGRTGSLFEHPFKRKIINDIEYFKTLVVYIHDNPVHHRITKYAMDYPWSSYLTCISIKTTHLQRDTVIGWFDNQANFKTAHEKPGDFIDFEKWLGL